MRRQSTHQERKTVLKGERHIGFRIDEELLRKFRYVCDYEGRSATSALLQLISQRVDRFEREHGKIKPEDTTYLKRRGKNSSS